LTSYLKFLYLLKKYRFYAICLKVRLTKVIIIAICFTIIPLKK
jgi:hypothetical protein